MDLSKFEEKIYSQHAEDGITKKLVELLYDNHTNKYFVEFGVESGSECNTRVLRELYKWNGLLMDGSNINPAINLQKEFLTKDNIISIFKKYNVPKHINVLCIDIDFNDFYCLKEILKHYTCDILICEYNGTHLPNIDTVIVYDENGSWDFWTNYFGASLLAFTKLAAKYNYTLVYCENSGTNCFFVNNVILQQRKLVFKDMGDINKVYRPPTYGPGPNGGHSQDPYYRPYITSEEAFNI
jgi:hypothetical protein